LRPETGVGIGGGSEAPIKEMKIAAYITGGESWVILTPEDKTEQDLLAILRKPKIYSVVQTQVYIGATGMLTMAPPGYAATMNSTCILLKEKGDAEA
jgi:hypothetical protein